MKKSEWKRVIKGLKAARKLLSKPERWTKCEAARDEAGMTVDPCSDSAVCFCVLGAVSKTMAETSLDERCAADRCLGDALRGYHSIIAFNDNAKTKHKQIMSLFDRAIKRAEKRAAKDA